MAKFAKSADQIMTRVHTGKRATMCAHTTFFDVICWQYAKKRVTPPCCIKDKRLQARNNAALTVILLSLSSYSVTLNHCDLVHPNVRFNQLTLKNT